MVISYLYSSSVFFKDVDLCYVKLLFVTSKGKKFAQLNEVSLRFSGSI